MIADVRFAVGLISDDVARAAYNAAKGGGHRMDFDRIAIGLSWPLERVAGVFLFACVLTPIAAYFVVRRATRDRCEASVTS